MSTFTSILPLAEVMNGHAQFSEDLPIFDSKFSDPEWHENDKSGVRKSVGQVRTISWAAYGQGRSGAPWLVKYEYCLSDAIVNDLKIASAIYSFYPNLLTNSKLNKRALDIATVKGRIEELAKFFSQVIRASFKNLGVKIECLSEIDFEDVRRAIATYPGRGQALKRALKLISDAVIQQNLSAPLKWKLVDITKTSLPWRQSPESEAIRTLSDKQFLFLLDHCKASVALFLGFIGRSSEDPESANSDFLSKCALRIGITKSAFEEFLAGGMRSEKFQRVHGLKSDDVREFVSGAHSCAMLLILLFTGMRVSEVQLLVPGCLQEDHGFWFLKSRVIKGRSKGPLSEGWLAIGLVKDAYHALNWFCQRSGSNYLFSPYLEAHVGSDEPYQPPSLNTKFNRYLISIDREGLFRGHSFSVHQCRETLVSQLAGLQVGLPYISMQLKHVYTQLNSMPNEVTIGYGNYRRTLISDISSRVAVTREDALLDIYGADSTFAGGGAAAHKVRIDSFFSGLGLYGAAREEYIREMARRGTPLMPTSVGNCTRNFLLPDGSSAPPCYGDYGCDPNCDSHVITARGAMALSARREHALAKADKEPNTNFKVIWLGVAEKLAGHVSDWKGGL